MAMRPSQRIAALDAALRLMSAGDGGTITLERVAREAGLSKPGLMYHFPTREALMLAIVEHAARSFEVEMERVLGKAVEEASASERVRAYASVAAHGADSRAEYAIFAEASYRPFLSGPWIERMSPWFELPDDADPDLRARLTTARLAADGLWGAEATKVFPPDARDRKAVLAVICRLAEEV